MKRTRKHTKRSHVQRVTLDLDKTLWMQLNRLAEQDDRTLRSVVERTLRNGLQKVA